jgi:hypothetical protein
MAGFGEFLGKTGEAAWQLFVWQIAGQVVSALLTPYLTELTYLVNEEHPDIVLPVNDLVTGVVRGHLTVDQAKADAVKLGIDGARFETLLEIARPKISAPDLAQMLVRGFITEDRARTEAGFTGVDPVRLDLLAKIAADAPSPTDLVIALRRKLIQEDSDDPDVPSFAGGIREGRLADKWIPMLKELGTQWPSPVDALQAELEGQLTHDEAQALYVKLGGDLQFYQWLFNSRGTAPTPDQALELYRRGIIPLDGTGPESVSVHQAFLEGPQRNKWFEPFTHLFNYVIPPRSVVAMVHQGVLTDEQAAAELAKSGAVGEQAAALIAEGHHRAAATSKNLTVTTILSLYESRLISDQDAHGLLVALGYSDDNATFEVELADLRRVIAALNAAVSRVHNLYVAHKITRDTAVSTLGALKVPADQITEVVRIWDLEVGVNVRQLTPAQIEDAWKANLIDTETAMSELVTLGYTPYDAWILLSIKIKAPAGEPPARNPSPIGTIP